VGTLAIGMQDEGAVMSALCRAQPNRYLLEILIPLGFAGQASKRRLPCGWEQPCRYAAAEGCV